MTDEGFAIVLAPLFSLNTLNRVAPRSSRTERAEQTFSEYICNHSGEATAGSKGALPAQKSSAWLPLYGSALLVGLFYTAQFLPYAVQYARAGLATTPSSYEWAARVHGASAGKTARCIIAPLLWPHCLGGAVLIFSISFRELVGSVLLRPPGMEAVSTFILREFDQGSPASGTAMGMIAIASAFLCIALARRLSQKNL
jgi:ABC-type Fe3+ transport system permease subunit